MSETRMVSADTSTTCTGLALYINGEFKDYAEMAEYVNSHGGDMYE